MNLLETLWGLLFRLFPCPIETGLRRIGNPGPESPVLVTCNFYLTMKRLTRILRGSDIWLLVADSKGINVWCAAGGEEFNTHSVVSIVKTSGIADEVNHRTLILPPLGAPGINANEVESQTGWKIKWGPVRAKDIPRFIEDHFKRDDNMKRVTYDLKERLDTALGSLFPFYLIGGIGFLLFGRQLLTDYFLSGAIAFVVYFSLCPWIPGKNGLRKAIFLDVIFILVFILTEYYFGTGNNVFRTYLIFAMIITPIYGLELGGMASTMPSDLDPFLARLGIGRIGNVAFAGTIRTELLNGKRELSYNRELCKGCRSCAEVCPQGVWVMDESKHAVLAHREACTACRACLVQCEPGAIQAPKVKA